MSELWEFDVYLIEDLECPSTDKDSSSIVSVLIVTPSISNIEKICGAL
jgi:hypothetical protein